MREIQKNMRTLYTLLIAFLTSLTSPLAVGQASTENAGPEFLQPDEAFQLAASASEDGILLTWTVAEGHYAYRKPFEVTAENSATVTRRDMVAPKGKLKEDQFFGTVETYRGSIPLKVPVVQGEGPTVIAATIQGCADAGPCYPPLTKRVTLNLTPTQGATKASFDSTSVTAQVAQSSEDESASRVNALSQALGIAPKAEPAATDLSAEADDPKRAERMRKLANALGVSSSEPEKAAVPSSPNSGSSPALSALADLGRSLGGGMNSEFLDPEQAFKLETSVRDDGTVEALWAIEDGYYLYRSKFSFTVTGGQGAALGQVTMKPGKVKDDDYFGRTEVYYQQAVASVPIVREASDGRQLKLRIRYQGCADAGLCYPPIDKDVSLVLPASFEAAQGDSGAGLSVTKLTAISSPQSAATGTGNPVTASMLNGAAVGEPMVSEQDRLTDVLLAGDLWLIIVTFFVGGLLLAFTPCVLPMIPILSGIIVGQGESVSRTRGFVLSFVYVQGMAITYTLLGVAAGMTGANIQAMFQDPYVLVAFALVFVALAMSMFGFYELQVPAGLQARLANLSNKQKSGSYLGVGVMGVLSAIIVGPCVAPPLIGALSYISKTGDPVLGATALYALAMGMGVPLLIVGASAGQLLPRAGAWMETVKSVFGVALLAVAIFFLERVVAGWIAMLLWASLFIVTAIYMGALDQMREGVSGWKRLWKGTGLVMLTYGVLLMVGAAGGNTDPLQPLKGVGGGVAAHNEELEFQDVKGVEGLQAALLQAKAQNRPVMLDYYADWCISCKEMEKFTFTDPGVHAALDGVMLLRTDVTENDALDSGLLKQFGLLGPPVIQFFMPDGAERKNFRIVGYMNAEDFRTHVIRALSKSPATLASRI